MLKIKNFHLAISIDAQTRRLHSCNQSSAVVVGNDLIPNHDLLELSVVAVACHRPTATVFLGFLSHVAGKPRSQEPVDGFLHRTEQSNFPEKFGDKQSRKVDDLLLKKVVRTITMVSVSNVDIPLFSLENILGNHGNFRMVVVMVAPNEHFFAGKRAEELNEWTGLLGTTFFVKQVTVHNDGSRLVFLEKGHCQQGMYRRVNSRTEVKV